MSSSIKYDSLQKAIEDIVGTYTDEVKEIVEEETIKSSKKAVSELKSKSPKDTGKYASGWKSQLETSRIGTSAVVYNANKPQLTHLLENGHANRGGGRTAPREHIKPVNDDIVEEYERNIIKRL